MCFRYIVECEDAPSQLEKEIRSERDEGPERELLQALSALAGAMVVDIKEQFDHTMGIISSWTVLVKGTMWRKQAR